jgi:hypothetical protein
MSIFSSGPTYTRPFALIIFVLMGITASAQHQDVFERPKMWKGRDKDTLDSGTLLKAFKNGQMDGHFRYYFMATDNADGLTDYYANAVGGGLRYETGLFHGFKFRVSGFYIFNVGSSDLTVRDPLTGRPNRYEIGLFDVEDPANTHDIDRLEELLVEYHFGDNMVKFGRMLINTPFINLQDGRMRPTEVAGFWFYSEEVPNLELQGGWIYAMSPRGTVRWVSTAETLGIYPKGTDIFGNPSMYRGNIESQGVFVVGSLWKATPKLDIKLWNYYFENVFNTALLQSNYRFDLSPKRQLTASAQFTRQDAVNNGGNSNPELAYIEKGSKSIVYGFRLKYNTGDLEFSGNYNRITAHSRFLMPREWGREPFFTFLPRERNEGAGDVKAFMAKALYHNLKSGVDFSIGYGYYHMPDVLNFRLNKYGLPSYTQLNLDLKYHFSGAFEGLDLHLLVASKFNQGDIHGDPAFLFNKVDMTVYNAVFNFHF